MNAQEMTTLTINGAEVTEQVRLVGGIIYLDADGDTYLQAGTDDVLKLTVSGSVKATWNATGFRVGDATAPTVSLEAANGLTVAAGNLLVPVGQMQYKYLVAYDNQAEMHTTQNDNSFVSLRARANGVGAQEIARMESDVNPRFCHTRPVNLLGANISELTIATGAITITAGVHTVDTEGDAASDDLTVISGGRVGDILILTPANADRTIVVKHQGDIMLSAGVDFTMDESMDFLVLLLLPSLDWVEISRSENHA